MHLGCAKYGVGCRWQTISAKAAAALCRRKAAEIRAIRARSTRAYGALQPPSACVLPPQRACPLRLPDSDGGGTPQSGNSGGILRVDDGEGVAWRWSL